MLVPKPKSAFQSPGVHRAWACVRSIVVIAMSLSLSCRARAPAAERVGDRRRCR